MRNHDSEIAVVGIETHHDVRFRTRMVATPFAANFVSDHEVTFLYDCLAFAKLLARLQSSTQAARRALLRHDGLIGRASHQVFPTSAAYVRAFTNGRVNLWHGSQVLHRRTKHPLQLCYLASLQMAAGGTQSGFSTRGGDHRCRVRKETQ